MDIDMVELFGNSLDTGDFIVGVSNKTTIDNAIYYIITPYKTGFMKSHSWDKTKYEDYLNLSYYDMVESRLSYTNYCYKMQSLDEYESQIYRLYMKYCKKRMKAIEYYNENKNYLPIGSIVSDRLSYHPMIYLGKASDSYYFTNQYYRLQNPNNYYYQNQRIEFSNYHYFLNLETYLRTNPNGHTLDDILEQRVKIKDIIPNLSLQYYSIQGLKNMKSSLYYIGQIDMAGAFIGNYDKKLLEEVENIQVSDLQNRYGFSSITDEMLEQSHKTSLKNLVTLSGSSTMLFISYDKSSLVILKGVCDNSNKSRKKK